MVRITILSGARAGEQCRIKQFPCVLGRSTEAQICVEDSGVWHNHLELGLDVSHSFWLRAFPNALVTVNDRSVTERTLRNGDLIQLGAVRLQFWLDETEQRGLLLRETLTWMTIAGVTAAQIGLISWLVH